MTPRKTCPRCGAEMALVGPETAIEGSNGPTVRTTTGQVW